MFIRKLEGHLKISKSIQFSEKEKQKYSLKSKPFYADVFYMYFTYVYYVDVCQPYSRFFHGIQGLFSRIKSDQ